MTVPLSKLNCHHCKLWHKSCPGIQSNNLDKTGNTYCIDLFQNFSDESVDGKESHWLDINRVKEDYNENR